MSDWHHISFRPNRLALLAAAAVAVGCGSDATSPVTSPDALLLNSAQVTSLDSSARVMVNANPGDGNLKALLDSTLLVLASGVEAKRLDVTTDVTTAPLYFVGVHRVVTHSTGSFSTWTLVGIDDPSHLANLVEVSGFARSGTGTAPTSVTGTIGDGTGVVNALFLKVGAAGAVTEWFANSGSVAFSSDAATTACPSGVVAPNLTCALETMHVHFSANAPTGTGGAGARQAAIATDMAVPTLRLTFTGS